MLANEFIKRLDAILDALHNVDTLLDCEIIEEVEKYHDNYIDINLWKYFRGDISYWRDQIFSLQEIAEDYEE